MEKNRSGSVALGLAASLVLAVLSARAQTVAPSPAAANPPTTQAQTADPPVAPQANPAAPAEQGGELQQITVTGYLIPRVGQGPQPVTNYDRNYIEKTGSQTTSDILQNLPAAVGN